jgi:exosortase
MSEASQAEQFSGTEEFKVGEIGGLSPLVRGLGFGALTILFLIYFLYPAFPTTVGKSLAGWTWYGCNPINGFLHGRFVPLAFGVMLWMAYQKTKNEVARPSYAGLALMVLAMLFYLVSIRTIQPRLALMGAPFLVVGFSQYLFGFAVTRHVIFPAFFLWFSIPVPGLETLLTHNLQLLITKACFQFGTFLGMDLVNVGTNIYVGESEVEVAGGCSGIRSLMALTMIAAIYGNYTQKPLWKKAFLFASSFPLAIVANFFRVFTIIFLTHLGFENFAIGTWHDWAGLLFFFPVALAGLYVVDFLLNFRTRRIKRVRRSVRTGKVGLGVGQANQEETGA